MLTIFSSIKFYLKGKQLKKSKICISALYYRELNLKEIIEWFTIKGKSRANRVWHLNNTG